MRKNILHIGSSKLTYEIREIVEIALVIKLMWQEIIWENIWDPVEKGEEIPKWMKNIVIDASKDSSSYSYSPSRWLLEARKYISSKNGKIWVDDIIFFNWLWDAISKIYKNLTFDARVIWPNPAYSTHSSAEASHAWTEHITYRLDPNNSWNPDLEELENKVKYNPNIVWILVVNPDNPTWAVFKKDVLEKIIDIAREYDLYVIFDEIYEKLTYDEKDKVLLSDIIWDIPGISMKWLSKDLPWPWSRCGWIEIYNKDKDENFSKYIDSILHSKMLEVCSTTLPQKVLSTIYESDNYKNYLKNRIEKYKQRAKKASDILSNLEEISIVEPKWAFYLTITFNISKFPKTPILYIKNKDIKAYINTLINNDTRFDRRFCYYLLASRWVCTVPLSWFNSDINWFRMTLLEEDFEKYINILNIIKEAIIEFSSES